MNWKTFKEEIEKKLILDGCNNPDTAEIEAIDFKATTLPSGITLPRTHIAQISYYTEANSFYVVG